MAAAMLAAHLDRKERHATASTERTLLSQHATGMAGATAPRGRRVPVRRPPAAALLAASGRPVRLDRAPVGRAVSRGARLALVARAAQLSARAPAAHPDSIGQVDDGLARPISFEARYGAGSARSLVLGGGGIVFVAWLTGYFGELARRGIRVDDADRIVGTSAGALLAAVICAGRLERFGRLLRLLADRRAMIERLAPASRLSASQERARDLFEAATDADPPTIRAIGAAALAAATPSPHRLAASLLAVLHTRRWPDDRLVVSAVDAYTGERLVLTRRSGVPLLRAVAASAAVPGLFAPQPLLDRRAMDGGVCGTAVHADLVGGAGRALVFPVIDAVADPRMTIQPDSIEREIAALRATGTAVNVSHSRLAETIDLMDPAEVPGALALGVRQACEDAPAIAAFWSG